MEKTMFTSEIDKMTCAELPPSTFEEGITPEEKAKRTPQWDLVCTHMIHGPCGKDNQDLKCMISGKCDKKFPKAFSKETRIDEEMGSAIYRRRSPADGGRTVYLRGKKIDNSWVVPYNP